MSEPLDFLRSEDIRKCPKPMPLPPAIPAETENDQFTGNYIGILNQDISIFELDKTVKKFSLKLAHTQDFSPQTPNYNADLNAAQATSDGLVLDNLKIVLMNPDSDAAHNFIASNLQETKNSFLTFEKERYVYASNYMQRLSATSPVSSYDAANACWGIRETNVLAATSTGKGVNIAILDTGFNYSHPGFQGRTFKKKSFMPLSLSSWLSPLVFQDSTDDKNGHGTHCAGIATGNVHHLTDQRYGIAKDANIYIAQVLDKNGKGTDSSVLRAIAWAVENSCRVISMSFASRPGDTYSESYETIAKEALKRNCLLIAAAGNASDRQNGYIKPVGHPANCPSIMAVAALDEDLTKVADFSCAGHNIEQPPGNDLIHQIDISAPGVNILSAWKNGSYISLSGTSMAAPFVAGIAALLWEENPQASAEWIKKELLKRAKPLQISYIDAGIGLVQY